MHDTPHTTCQTHDRKCIWQGFTLEAEETSVNVLNLGLWLGGGQGEWEWRGDRSNLRLLTSGSIPHPPLATGTCLCATTISTTSLS